MSAVSLSTAERERVAALDPAGLARALAVYTGEALPAASTPAIAGAHRLDAEGLHFEPLFRFVPGLRYFARFDTGDGAAVSRVFELPRATGEPPRVAAVFPSSDTLPENTLRVYLHFSQPMETRDAHAHVRLEDAHGRAVPLAFVEVPQGLWDPGRTRLTLLFHPGRIKRGVAPGEALGPPLREGGRYRLVVDAAMRSAAGLPMGAAFEHELRASPADREPPSAEALRLGVPETAAAPLVVELPEPLDEALLRRMVWVEDERGERVLGRATVTDGEVGWRFEPDTPWRPGRYALRIDRRLEDRAGNRFDRAFDRPFAMPAGGPAAESPLTLEFTVPAPAAPAPR